MKDLLPKELIPYSIEVHRHKYLKKSQAIYFVLLLFLISGLIALPLIEIDTFSTSPGVIRTESEPLTIQATTTGFIEKFLPEENCYVHEGDTLVVIAREDLRIQDSLIKNRLDSVSFQLNELRAIVSSNPSSGISSKSAWTRSSLVEFNHLSLRLERTCFQFKRIYLRHKRLYEKGVIALTDLEKSKYQYEQSRSELELFRSRHQLRFAEALRALVLKREDLLVLRAQVENQKKNLTILSPVSGYVKLLSGFSQGSHVQKGIPLLQITPESDLIAECYVSSDDIGSLKPSQVVEFQIASFRNRGLGPVKGRVISLGSEVNLIEGKPVIEVRCSLDSIADTPIAPELRRGMTLLARFRLARRSVFDLIVEDMEESQMDRS